MAIKMKYAIIEQQGLACGLGLMHIYADVAAYTEYLLINPFEFVFKTAADECQKLLEDK